MSDEKRDRIEAGKAIRDQRRAYGMTQAEIAGLFGVTVRTWQGWEKGRHGPKHPAEQNRLKAFQRGALVPMRTQAGLTLLPADPQAREELVRQRFGDVGGSVGEWLNRAFLTEESARARARGAVIDTWLMATGLDVGLTVMGVNMPADDSADGSLLLPDRRPSPSRPPAQVPIRFEGDVLARHQPSERLRQIEAAAVKARAELLHGCEFTRRRMVEFDPPTELSDRLQEFASSLGVSVATAAQVLIERALRAEHP